jgi:hypothetical protein
MGPAKKSTTAKHASLTSLAHRACARAPAAHQVTKIRIASNAVLTVNVSNAENRGWTRINAALALTHLIQAAQYRIARQLIIR